MSTLSILKNPADCEDTPPELGVRLAIFGVSGQAGSMFLGILQAALYKNLNGVAGLQVRFTKSFNCMR